MPNALGIGIGAEAVVALTDGRGGGSGFGMVEALMLKADKLYGGREEAWNTEVLLLGPEDA